MRPHALQQQNMSGTCSLTETEQRVRRHKYDKGACHSRQKKHLHQQLTKTSSHQLKLRAVLLGLPNTHVARYAGRSRRIIHRNQALPVAMHSTSSAPTLWSQLESETTCLV